MKSMRMLGCMIEKIAQENKKTPEQLGRMLDCTTEQVEAMYKGRIYPSFAQLEKLADSFRVNVESILRGDEEYYENNFVHCMEKFEKSENREFILDIIDDYLRLKDAVSL